jgi:hypothetical protein
MFAINRSAFAVLAPLALLAAAVWWSNHSTPQPSPPQAQQQPAGEVQTVAANFPSR